jgi:ribonuclease HI
LILGLEKAIATGYKNKIVTILMDSELVIRQMKGEFKVKNIELQSLFVKAYNLTLSFKKVIFKYIPREQNKQADSLVNKNLDQNQK